MNSDTPDFCVGQPQFGNPEWQALAKSAGPLAAWRAAFEREGAAAPKGVSGSFAVGVALSEGRVFLAVDRFAVHSLCYRLQDGRLAHAPRADAVAPEGARLDHQALFDYLYWHAIPSPRTVFDGVQRVPPGHCVSLQGGRLSVQAYWVPTFEPATGGVSFDQLRDRFRELLKTAVGQQLDGSPPACFLSGGTDSSTIAGMIGVAAGRPAATYSIGFDAAGYDEMAYARIAAKHFGTQHHEYYVTPDDLVQSIPRVASHYDQPFGNSSAVPAFHCARRALDDGVTRLLAGDGGDELFGGNTRYAKQRVFGWWDDVPRPLQGLLSPFFALPVVAGTPGLSKVSSYIAQASVPMPQRIQSYNLLHRLGVTQVLTPAFLRSVEPGAPDAQQQAVWDSAKATTLVDKQLAFDWRYTLAENDLPKVCGTAGLAGVEVRFPMLDDALVAFSAQLPTSYKLKGLKLRWFFKEALRGFLPDEILTKKKQGFGLPFGVWALRHDALRGLARESLSTLSERGIVQPAFIRDLLDHRLAEHPGYYGEMIWILMMLEQWLRVHAPDFRIQD